jgi:hypothetical protein
MFSPTSIADFLACQHLTALNRAEAAEQIKRPYFPDPTLELLISTLLFACLAKGGS